MKHLKIVWALACLCIAAPSYSQDLIILKNNDREIQCKIISVSDSIIEYKEGRFSDSTYRVHTQEVLSYRLNKKTSSEEVGLGSSDPDEGLLVVYKMGQSVPGYVITSGTDTIEGYIQVKDVVASQFKVVFLDESGNKKEYTTADLTGYGYDQVHYEKISGAYSKTLHPGYRAESGTLFLHRIVTGTSKLYRIFKIDFNKGTLAQNPYPPLYMGKLDHEYLCLNPEGVKVISFGKGARGTIGTTFEKYPKFTNLMGAEKIHKHDLPVWFERFNSWYAEQPRN